VPTTNKTRSKIRTNPCLAKNSKKYYYLESVRLKMVVTAKIKKILSELSMKLKDLALIVVVDKAAT